MMKVTLEMDCMTLTAVRADTEPSWEVTIDQTLDETAEKTATAKWNDAEVSAVAALALGIVESAPEDAVALDVGKALYAIAEPAVANLGPAHRPIP